MSIKRPCCEEFIKHHCCEEFIKHHCCEQITLTDLPTDLLNLIIKEVPQLRFASNKLYDKTKGWKLPPGAEYPSLTNKHMMCMIHTQKSFSGQVMIDYPEKYFHERNYQIHNGRDPYDLRCMREVTCFHCLKNKPLPPIPFYENVKPLPGNYSSVISCCSKKCNDALNTMIQLTDVKLLKNKKIKIPSLGEDYEDVEFYIASFIPQSDGKKLSYYLQGSLVDYEEISVWASIDDLVEFI